MQRFNMVIPILIVLLSSACISQASPEGTAAPATPVETATEAPVPTDIPEATDAPRITLASEFPVIIPSSDLFNQVVSVDPADEERIAHCAPGEIRVSEDGGLTWNGIPTAGVTSAAEEHGYELFYGEPGLEGTCLSAALDPRFPEAYYALFSAAQAAYGAPPVFYMGLYTADSGETWQFIEAPAGATYEDFGGFWNLGGESVQALFHEGGTWRQEPDAMLITETADGGVNWQSGELSCPAAGPCLRWGPAPSNVPGMGSPLPQSLFFSPDEGQTWSAVDPPLELRTPTPNQLVVLSETQALIISGGISLSDENADAIRVSRDGGATWDAVTVPPLAADETSGDYFPGLQYLANDSYLSQGAENSTWYWLNPELPIWCPVDNEQLPAYPVLLQGIGEQVWWVDQVSQQAVSIPLTALTCAVE